MKQEWSVYKNNYWKIMYVVNNFYRVMDSGGFHNMSPLCIL